MKSEEREFFRKIKDAITVNPFSRDRLAVDLELTGMSPSAPADKILSDLITKVEMVINRVRAAKEYEKGVLGSEDFMLLRSGMLFRAFHLFCDDFDKLIRDQIEKGEKSCKVFFASTFIELLASYGFEKKDALRFLALFFQMRRAYFFISRIAGDSQCIRDLRKRLWNNIFTCDIELYDQHLVGKLEDFSTLLLGETGTGKGLAAAAIGRSAFIPFDAEQDRFSESFAKAFISINLSQFPEQLIESELFGHKKGAFTGAFDGHEGVFAKCSPHGAIFLDEIGDVSVPVQIKLLKVLQERSFSPVGSRMEQRFHGRVIAATNQSLGEMRERGDFREDFYYRLCSDVIEIPPLRDRITENPREIDVILPFIVRRIFDKDVEDLTAKITDFINDQAPPNYMWSGNIRELEQCVRQYLLRNEYSWQSPISNGVDSLSIEFEEGTLTAKQLLSYYCSKIYKELGTYESVAKRTDLDRRTVKKYLDASKANSLN